MQVFTDKEILNDGLCSQKATTGKLNMAANECVHEDLRKQILNVLGEEHSIQYEVFNMMHQRGLYQIQKLQKQNRNLDRVINN